MAKLGDLIVRIGADTRDLNKQLGRVQREMRSMTGNLAQLGQNMTRAITVPLAGLGALAVKSAADLEKLEASFVSLTGGVDQAAAMMKQLNEFTASTPFQIENVANAARQLIASGTEIGEVNNQLRFLGDIAATSGVTIEEIAAIFAKVNAKGKVELENLNQLAERGIPIFKALADATGLPADSLGAGAVSVKQFNEVLKSFAKEGGFAAGAMERLSQTAAGKFSTALDNLKLAGATLGEEFLPIINKLLDKVVALSQSFAELSPNVKRSLTTLGGMAGVLGPILYIIPQITTQLKLMSDALKANPILAAAGVVTSIGIALQGMKSDADNARKSIEQLRDSFSQLTDESREEKRADAAETIKQLLAYQELGNQFKALEDQLLSEGFKTGTAGYINRLNPLLRELKAGFSDAELAVYNFGKEYFKVNDYLAPSVANHDRVTDAIIEQQEKMAALTVQQVVLAESTADTTSAIVEETKAIEEAGNKTFWLLVQLNQMSTPQIGGLLDMLEGVKVKLQEVGDVAKETGNAIQSAIQNAVSDSLVALGEGIGKMLSGGLQGVNLMAGALMQLGNLMKSIGKAMVAQATAMIAFQKTLFKNPYLAAAAGVAFIAAGALLSNYATNLQEMPALAEGGLAYGATTAIVGDNPNARIDPEVIAPLSKLQDMMGGQRVEVFGRISGDDIYLSNARTSRNRNRYS